MPLSPLILLIFFVLLALLLFFIQAGILTIAFEKLGLSSGSAVSLLFISLMGSFINLPLFKLKSTAREAAPIYIHPLFRKLIKSIPPFQGYTTITINVGGGLVPVAFSLYLLLRNTIPAAEVIGAIIMTTAVSYFFSRPVAGVGIGIPILITPLAAAIIALFISPGHSAPVAYVCGVYGVLIGADLLRLKEVRHMGTPFASIGGAGTFDGIFITGIVAVLLA